MSETDSLQELEPGSSLRAAPRPLAERRGLRITLLCLAAALLLAGAATAGVFGYLTIVRGALPGGNGLPGHSLAGLGAGDSPDGSSGAASFAFSAASWLSTSAVRAASSSSS